MDNDFSVEWNLMLILHHSIFGERYVILELLVHFRKTLMLSEKKYFNFNDLQKQN